MRTAIAEKSGGNTTRAEPEGNDFNATVTSRGGNHMSKNKTARLLSMLLTLILIVSGIAISPTQAAAASKTKVGDACYTILSENSATAEYAKPTKKTCTTTTIPDTVKIGKKTYKVTSIAANAFKGCSKLKKVTIGKNVTKIGKKAFYGCKNLKTIKINTTKLTKKSVGSKAFAKINAKAVVTVPKNKLKAYKTILKGAGLNGKGQKVKGEAGNKHINEYNPSESQFDEGGTGFSMVKLESGNDKRIDDDTNIFTAGDSFEITSQCRLLPPVYGYWMKDSRKIENRAWMMCMGCREYYPNDMAFAMHEGAGMAKNGVDNMACRSGHFILGWTTPSAGPKDTWYFVPDDNPCSLTLTYRLPDGVSCNKEDISVSRTNSASDQDNGIYLPDIDLTSICKITTVANTITITFDNIKQMPLYERFDVDAYLKDMGYYDGYASKETLLSHRYQIKVKFNGLITENIEQDSRLECNMAYSYKGSGMDKTFSRSIHTAAMQVANTDADGNSLTGAEFDLYRTRYNYSGSIGTSEWELLAGGLHAGDVVKGLGMGSADWENEYRLVQTKAPNGYTLAQPVEFTVKIDTTSGKTVITAADSWEDDELPVKDGVITVTVVNAGGETGSSSSSTPTKESDTETASKDTNSSSSDGIPTGGSTADDRDKASTVLVSYYKNGVRHSYAIHKEDKIDSDGMLDTAKYVKSYATGGFADCKLEKLTINGEAVSSLPAKVPAGTEICYYYVTR